MDTKPENPQAFPLVSFDTDGKESIHEPGMTLRDYFAAGALNGMVSGYDPESKTNGAYIPEYEYRVFASQAYQMADAMLAERSKVTN